MTPRVSGVEGIFHKKNWNATIKQAPFPTLSVRQIIASQLQSPASRKLALDIAWHAASAEQFRGCRLGKRVNWKTCFLHFLFPTTERVVVPITFPIWLAMEYLFGPWHGGREKTKQATRTRSTLASIVIIKFEAYTHPHSTWNCIPVNLICKMDLLQ